MTAQIGLSKFLINACAQRRGEKLSGKRWDTITDGARDIYERVTEADMEVLAEVFNELDIWVAPAQLPHDIALEVCNEITIVIEGRQMVVAPAVVEGIYNAAMRRINGRVQGEQNGAGTNAAEV